MTVEILMKKNKFFNVTVFILFCAFFLCSFTSCSSAKSIPVSQTGFHFDTVITVTIYSGGTENTLNSCFELAGAYEKLFSRTMEGSDIYRINHSGGTPTDVSTETADLIKIALDYATLTNGIVDPTIGSVSSLWDFHEDASLIPPDDTIIQDALSHVDYRSVLVDGTSVTLTDPDARLDLGFIAKGYIADKLKEHLLSEGVTSALINLGGNILAVGAKPDNSTFTIGIQKPFADTGTPITTVSVKDASVISSGIYERYFEYNGTLYHHILDTQTGYPVNNDLLGVSILSESSTDGDALSTICLALGYEKALDLIHSLDDVEAIFITSDNEVHFTY